MTMKKWVLVVCLGVLALVLCSYLVIPGRLSVHQSLSAPVNFRSLQRGLSVDTQWVRWWPGEKTDTRSHRFHYNGYTYTLTDRKLTTQVFTISKGKFATEAALNFIPVGPDTVAFNWVIDQPVPLTPAKRLQAYFVGKQLNKDLRVVLEKMSAFYSNPDNIYGVAIKKALVVDSVLVSTFGRSKGYPSTELIYGLIDQLKAYTASQGARETGYPMLNVSTEDSATFLTKVALPVDRRLKGSGNIAFRWMLGGGNILITEVKGGPASIKGALEQLEHYISDYQRVAPAIPFQSLVTDRRKVPDTTQWVTRIFYQVM